MAGVPIQVLLHHAKPVPGLERGVRRASASTSRVGHWAWETASAVSPCKIAPLSAPALGATQRLLHLRCFTHCYGEDPSTVLGL